MKHDGFWAGGGMERVRQIQREMTGKLQPLQEQLATEKDKEKRALLKQQIKDIRTEYAQKERQANYSLFNRR